MKKIMYFIIWGVSMFVLLQTPLLAIQNIQSQENDLIIKENNSYYPNGVFLVDEIIDQNQSINSGNSVQLENSSDYYAQRFQPQLNVLTKISVLISKPKPLDQNSKFTISLRKYLHKTIVKKEVNMDDVSINATWIECDFGSVNLIQNESYYIVCHMENASRDSYVNWFFGINDPYPLGKPYYAIDDTEWKEFSKGVQFPNLDFCFITKGFQNSKPQIPLKPDGPTTGQYGKEYTYSTSTNDSNNDLIYFKWSWGDGKESEWLGPYQSDQICDASHIWMIKGSYLIKVKAKDSYGFETDWSEPLTIKMEKYKIYSLIEYMLTYFLHFHE